MLCKGAVVSLVVGLVAAGSSTFVIESDKDIIASGGAGFTRDPTPFVFAKALGDGMVLAASPKQAMVWGFCNPNSSVTVSLDGESVVMATVGPDQADGSLTTWRALLPATVGGFDKHRITATLDNDTILLSDVMFGEVWVCSGQSNMEYPIGNPTCWNASNINCTDTDRSHDRSQCSYGCSENAGDVIAAMGRYDKGMRLFKLDHSSQAEPQAEMHGNSGWLAPSKMGGGFSAVCWHYGRDIYDALSAKVPVGLIQTTWGGTPSNHWESPDALEACMGSDSWQWPVGFKDSVLWNGQVVPLLRTVLSGVAWYQGENDAAYPRRYNCSFPALIGDWRRKWNKYTDGATAIDFPFGWVQIASTGNGNDAYHDRIFNPEQPPSNCGTGCTPSCSTECLGDFHEWGDYNDGFTGIRFAQDNTLNSVANTFQALNIDTPVASGSIHSPFKPTVGRRLARGGLAVAYGVKEANAVYPVVTGVRLQDDQISVELGGLGLAGLAAIIGSKGFEVLGNCSGPVLCWKSAPIASADVSSVTLKGLPMEPRAVRYLWYIAPYGTQPFRAPIYTQAAPILAARTSDNNFLPLGPFVLPLDGDDTMLKTIQDTILV